MKNSRLWNKYKGEQMKVWYFVLYALYLLFGCFTIMFIGYYLNMPVWISYLVGGIWGFIVGTDAQQRFN